MLRILQSKTRIWDENKRRAQSKMKFSDLDCVCAIFDPCMWSITVWVKYRIYGGFTQW